MKKVIIFLGVLLLLVASVSMVWAAESAQIRDEGLVQEARQLYQQCLYSSGRESFYGMCGLMTSYQLWRLGINESLEVYDGNKQFDAYKNLKVTTGGHNVKVYSAEDCSLLAALNSITQNGTRPARNILVGFQWTSTQAGGSYGHACVINAIEDGTVYFTESFDYAMGKLEGQVITCSVEEFADFFDGWTKYEGCIDFGTKQYANTCAADETDLFVQLRFDSNLRSQPCLIGQNDCRRLRSLTAGELLHATGVYTSGDGDQFYRIDDGGVTGYVSANAVHLAEANLQTERADPITDGWVYANGTWYCYENGVPCTGWVTRFGVEYYLKADGSVTTGWAEEDGWVRYFSATGALCNGWVTTPGGTYYWVSDGVIAQGLQEIEGKCYWFGTDGKLWTDGRATVGETVYHIDGNGVAVPAA